MRKTIQVGVSIIILNNGKFLIEHRIGLLAGADTWAAPDGRMKFGEM